MMNKNTFLDDVGGVVFDNCHKADFDWLRKILGECFHDRTLEVQDYVNLANSLAGYNE